MCAEMSTKPLREVPTTPMIWRLPGFCGRIVLIWIFNRVCVLNASVSRRTPTAGPEDTAMNLRFSQKAVNSLSADKLWTMHEGSAPWRWTIINYQPSARQRNGHHNIHVAIWLWNAQIFLQPQLVLHREQNMPVKQLFLYTPWRYVGWWRYTSCLLYNVTNTQPFLGFSSYVKQKQDVTHSLTHSHWGY